MSDSTLLWAGETDVGGDPEDVRRLASRLGSCAGELSTAADRVRGLVDALAGWRGDAADTCLAQLRGNEAVLAEAREECARAGAALTAYAERLEDAQLDAARAHSMWREADRLTVAWGVRQSYIEGVDASVTSAADDPGAERRGWAGAVLGSALDQRDAAAVGAARVLADVEEVLRRHAARRRPEELLRHVGRDVRQGVTAGLRDAAESTRWLLDAPLDPGGAVGDVSDSLAWTAAHPIVAAQELVGWDDLTGGHPLRAVSELAPGAVATYLTGGVAKGIDLSRHGSDRPEPEPGLWDMAQRPAPGPVEAAGGAAVVLERARRIAFGHAWSKPEHAADWAKRGVQSPGELAAMVEEATTHPTLWVEIDRGRTIYWDENTSLFVVSRPTGRDGGTAYVPKDGIDYFLLQIGNYFGRKEEMKQSWMRLGPGAP